jgi:ElaB/YqjD/DUF883 family membrane-anchored ribosome-binding protein
MADTEAVQTGQGADELRQQVQTLRADLDTIRGDLKNVLRAAGARGKDKLSDAKAMLGEACGNISNQAKEVYDSALEHGEEAAERARSEISKRPLTIVLLAFLSGVVLGKMVRWR